MEDGEMSTIAKATLLRVISQKLTAAELVGSTTTAPARFVIHNGPIEVKYLGILVETAIPAGANTLKFRFTPAGGSQTDICGATDTASAGAQQIFLVNGVKATGLLKSTEVGIVTSAQTQYLPFYLGNGSIYLVFSGSAPATGLVKLFMCYYPLSADTIVKMY
jgi:hypothetical protein